jgi:hypothetical protein
MRIVARAVLLVFVTVGTAHVAEPAPPLKSLEHALADTAIADIGAKPFAAVPLSKEDAAAARELLWKAHVKAIAKDRTTEVRDKVLKDGNLEMPYFSKSFGKKPAGGWSLWISMHGGGNAPKRVNDQQWENQKKLYTPEEGLYLAPRAPTDAWDLWHQDHIDRLFTRLVEDLVALEGVDPDRVYLMGYSAGGDGVYQLAPRMADQLAAASMMAGHPNNASPLGLRNLPFAIQVGGKDAAYDRNKVAVEWGQKLDKLRENDPDGYEHFVKIHEDKGHWMDREDAAVLPWMAKRTRNPVPKRVVWMQGNTAHDRFYWLALPAGEAKPGALVEAKVTGQTVEIVAAESVGKLLIRLDDRLLDLNQAVKVTHKGKVLFDGPAKRTVGTLAKTLAGRGDPKLVFDAEIAVVLPH